MNRVSSRRLDASNVDKNKRGSYLVCSLSRTVQIVHPLRIKHMCTNRTS